MAPVLTTALLEVTVTVSLCIFLYVEFKHAVHASHFYPAIVPEFLSFHISVKRTLQSSVQLAYDIGSRKYVTRCTCVLPVFMVTSRKATHDYVPSFCTFTGLQFTNLFLLSFSFYSMSLEEITAINSSAFG